MKDGFLPQNQVLGTQKQGFGRKTLWLGVWTRVVEGSSSLDEHTGTDV